jgi:Mg2+-importing ATPase
VKEASFQTSWFVESILTELFILFIIRTHKSFFKSRPGNYLFWLSLLGLVLTIGLPYSPLAQEVGLVALPFKNLLFMLAIVLAYIITSDWLKIWFFKKHKYS